MSRTQPFPICVLVLVLALSGSLTAQSWSGVLAPSRAVDWSNAGAGPIPARPSPGSNCSALGTAGQSPTFSQNVTAGQINAAIAACGGGQVVYLNPGTYKLSSNILFNAKRNVTLRGAGADQTLLVFNGGISGCGGLNGDVCFTNGDGNYYGQPGNTANWTGGYSQGSTQITLDSTANLQVGTVLILDQLTDSSDSGDIFMAAIQGTTCVSCSVPGRHTPNKSCTPGNDCRPQVQLTTVANISGKTITISPGVYMPNWNSSKSPGAWWSTYTPITGSGIEDVSIDSSNSSATDSITFYNAANCWIKGVRSIRPLHHHFRFWQSAHITVRDSYLFSTQDNVQESYGTDDMLGSDNLVENNIFQQIAAPMVHESCAGCVDGYNFSIYDLFGNPAHTWASQAMFTHAPGNTYVLDEGNNGFGMMLDDIHGPSEFTTAFRNRWYGYEGSPAPANQQQTIPILIYAFSRYVNVVGNVLGTPGFHTNYQNNVGGTNNSNQCYQSIFSAGWGGNCGSNPSRGVIDDPIALSSSLRWGNYDTVNGANRFVGSEVPSGLPHYSNPVPGNQNLPASFYYSGTPAWWPTGKPFPATGPDVSGGTLPNIGGHSYTIPALDCFSNVMNGPADGSGGALSFNASACYSSSSQVPQPPQNVKATVK